MKERRAHARERIGKEGKRIEARGGKVRSAGEEEQDEQVEGWLVLCARRGRATAGWFRGACLGLHFVRVPRAAGSLEGLSAGRGC